MFCLLLLSLSLVFVAHGASLNYPVVYIIYGAIPDYLKVNIEIASRKNPVVIISDVLPESTSGVRRNIIYENMNNFMEAAHRYEPKYVDLFPRMTGANHRLYEKRCFLRWFVLMDYMRIRGVQKALYADGDSTVFTSVESAWKMREGCSAVINIETQNHKYHWVGAGESSLWTVDSLADLCSFIDAMYSDPNRIAILNSKRKAGSNVVDMTLLWLWWVAHFPTAGWEAGRPYLTKPEHDVNRAREMSDDIFSFSKSLPLPEVRHEVKLCNGMKVVNRTVFDHMMAWRMGPAFSLDLQGSGNPYVIAPCLNNGGAPESVSPSQVAALAKQKLYLNNIHFIGGNKPLILSDVCRILTMTGDKYIENADVKSICAIEMEKIATLPCVKHEDSGVCV